MPRSKDETKRQLLDAGAELLLHDGLPEAVNVKLADVCKHLEVTSGSAYQIWRRQEDYQLDLTLYIVENFNWATGLVAAAVADALVDFESPEQVIRTVGHFYFDKLISSPEFYLLLHLWSIHDPRPELSEAIRRSYSQVHEGLNQVFLGAMAAFGTELKPAFSIDEMSVTATAVSEGLALRHRFDPERATGGELYAEALVGLFRHYTRPVSEPAQPDFT